MVDTIYKRTLLLIIIVVSLTTLLLEPLIVEGMGGGKLDDGVKSSLLVNGFSEFLVISNDLSKTYSLISSNAIRVFNEFGMILAVGDLTVINKLIREPSVVRIVPNFKVRIEITSNFKVLTLGDSELEEALYSWGRSRVGGKVVSKLYNISGSDVIVAVLDTGISLDHEELKGKLITINPLDRTYPGGWIEFNRKGVPVCSTPRDTHFHGTWVSSIIAGEFIGIAPNVKLMHGLVLHGGEGTAAQLLAGLEWVLQPYTCTGVKTQIKPNIVSLSLGASGNYSDVFLKPISRLIQEDIIVIAAIGNDGPGTTSNPGNIWGVIGVGATNRDDEVADFSSSEVVEWPSPPDEWPFRGTYPKNYVKPDFTSPGVLIPGAYVVSGYYVIASGTSASTPIVSGVTALVLEAFKTVGRKPTINDVYEILNKSADKVCDLSRCGWGIVNAVKAVSQALGRDLNEVEVKVNATDVQVFDTILLTSKHNLNYFLDDLKLGSGSEVVVRVPISDMGYHTIHAVSEGEYGRVRIFIKPKAVIRSKTVTRGEYLELTLLGFPGASDVLIYLGSNLLTYKPLNLLGYESLKLSLPYISSGSHELLIMNFEGPIIIKDEVYVREELPGKTSFTLIALSPPSQHTNSTVDVYIISLINGTVREPRKLYYQFLSSQPMVVSDMSRIAEGIYRLSYTATSSGVYVILFRGEVEVDGYVINATAVAVTNITLPDVDLRSVITNTTLKIQNLTSNLSALDFEVQMLRSELENLNSTLNQLNYTISTTLNEVLKLRTMIIVVILVLFLTNLIVIKHLKRHD
ncbi:MAG: S8 family serine peptidase [Sulfolobales archaeon]